MSHAIALDLRGLRQGDRYVASLPPKERELFYIADSDQGLHGGNVVDAVAKLTLEFWNSISNDFNGVGDPNWSSALETWNACFDRYGEQPIGMALFRFNVAGPADPLLRRGSGVA